MARSETLYRTFNRGLISDLALARTDVERTGLSAETMDNWMARRLGPMMLRPGTAYIGGTLSDNKARYIPFVFSSDDKALLELTATTMRVWLNEAVVTRPTVPTMVADSEFAVVVSWTDNDELGGTSQVTSVGAVDYLELEGDGTNAAIRTQEVIVAGAYQATEHGIKVEVGMLDYTATGNLSGLKPTLRIGTTDGDDDLISEVVLDNGQHHFAFTPNSGSFFIQFSNRQNGSAFVRTCEVESSGDLSITTLWAEADLSKVRYDQSGNVIYLACKDCPPCKIVRHTSDSKSWGVVLYEPEDGPFGLINTGAITLTPSALSGEVTLTASGNFWKSSDVGRLVRLVSNGQTVSANISAENTFTNTIRVSGANNARIFQIDRSGTWTATVTLQRSVTAEDSGFTDVTTYTTNGTVTYDDGLDNQIAWYRIGIKTGDYTSGTAVLQLDYSQGGIEGIARVYLYTSATVVSASTLTDFGGTDAQEDWYLGEWSTRSGFPSAVAFYEGRLAWLGSSAAWLSESDAYEVFDDAAEGDAATIKRTIGSGPVDTVNWAISSERLLLGTDSAEHYIRSSGDDDILTPSNANIKDYSTHGSALIQPSKLDNYAIFVERNGTRVMKTGPVADIYGRYATEDLTTLYPEAGGDSKIVHTAVQRQPDTRIHCVRTDGTVAILVHDPVEQVSCWLTMQPAQGQDYEYASKSYNNNALDGITRTIQISEDGTKAFLLGAVTGAIYGFTLDTPGDIDTLRYTGNSFDLTNEISASTATDMRVINNGAKIYVLQNAAGTDAIYEYTATTDWDVDTISYSGNSLDISNEATVPDSFSISDDGTKVVVRNFNMNLYLYTINTAYDISSGVYTGTTADISAEHGTGAQGCLYISPDGVRLISGAANGFIYRYVLAGSYDISSVTYTGYSFDHSSETTTSGGRGLAFSATQDKMYITGNTDDTVYQYNQVANNAVVEDVVVLPGDDGDPEDKVYYAVKRTVNSATVRYLERWALESECQGGTQNKNLDSHITGTVSGGILTGLTHLEGETIKVWSNGVDAGSYTVSGGQITGVTDDGSAVAGLSYTAQWKSTKLPDLMAKKNVAGVGFMLKNTHYQGLTYGPNFTDLDELPLMKDEAPIADDTVHSQFHEETMSFNGNWDVDSRICLQAQSPRPCTVLLAAIEVEK